jgi:excisionase family DNA binding protein
MANANHAAGAGPDPRTLEGIRACSRELTLATPTEMAEILRCSPPQVLRLMRAGTIPVAFSVGRLHRFDPSAVLAALAAHKAAPEVAETPRGEP